MVGKRIFTSLVLLTETLSFNVVTFSYSLITVSYVSWKGVVSPGHSSGRLKRTVLLRPLPSDAARTSPHSCTIKLIRLGVRGGTDLNNWRSTSNVSNSMSILMAYVPYLINLKVKIYLKVIVTHFHHHIEYCIFSNFLFTSRSFLCPSLAVLRTMQNILPSIVNPFFSNNTYFYLRLGLFLNFKEFQPEDILKEIKDESEIKAKAVCNSSFQTRIQMIEWEYRYIGHKNMR